MPNELLVKKIRARVIFGIGWFFGGTYLFFFPMDNSNWIAQNGWWLCFLVGFVNLIELFFLVRRSSREAKTDSG